MGTTNRQFNPGLLKAQTMQRSADQKRNYRLRKSLGRAAKLQEKPAGFIAKVKDVFGWVVSIFKRKKKAAPVSRKRIGMYRHFSYLGVDGNRHEVRQGNVFKVRPERMPFAVIATPDNRMILSI